MKKLFLSFFMLGIFANVTAQKNSILVFGDLGFNSIKDAAHGTHKTYFVHTGIGYQFSDNWTGGLITGVEGVSENTNDTKSTLLKIGPFARYTHTLSELFSMYVQAEVCYLGSKYENNNAPAERSTGVAAVLAPAIALNVKKGFALNFGLGGLEYGRSKFSTGGGYNSNFSFTLGRQVNIGISKNFARRK